MDKKYKLPYFGNKFDANQIKQILKLNSKKLIIVIMVKNGLSTLQIQF